MQCKCYANCFAVTDSKINAEVGKISRQIENYLELSLKRIVIVTNYNETDANKLRAALKDQFAGIKDMKELLVFGSDLNTFFRFLDQESEKIEQATAARFQQEFNHRIAKQLAKKDSQRKRLTP